MPSRTSWHGQTALRHRRPPLHREIQRRGQGGSRSCWRRRACCPPRSDSRRSRRSAGTRWLGRAIGLTLGKLQQLRLAQLAGVGGPRDLRAAATSGMFGSDASRSLLMLKFSVGTVMQSSSASLPLPNNPAAVSNLVIRTAAIGNRSLIVAVGRVGRACRPPSFADDLSHLRSALDRASIATTFASLPIRPERPCGSEQGSGSPPACDTAERVGNPD